MKLLQHENFFHQTFTCYLSHAHSKVNRMVSKAAGALAAGYEARRAPRR